jgi:hypothetical protein
MMAKPRSLFLLFFVLAAPLLRADPVVSGYLDSTVFMGAGAGSAPGFLYGLEEYANIRLQARVRDEALFYASFNLIASAGTYASANPGASPGFSAQTAGENYAAAMELERLYFKISREKADFQGGLTRMAFGYGLAFGPMDFMNPRNPLRPDARPRAVLGADLAYYPWEDAKILGFTAAAREDPFAVSGAGTLAGLAGEYHGDFLSIQGLYAYESPHDALNRGLHRFGLSLKGDLILGLAAEGLYTWDPLKDPGAGEGLALSLGLDYAFLGGDLYFMAEYLYSGDRSSTASSPGFAGDHYLYVGGLYRPDDYTGLGLACMAALEDLSFSPVLTVEHELFQGLILSLNCQIPLPPGASTGTRFQGSVKARLRF